MTKGQTWPAEHHAYTDRLTGVRVRRLTNYKGHSHHFYFTNPGWWDNGRRLLFGSDRGNRTNLFSLELESGEITQLTDMDQPPPPGETSFLFASVSPTQPEAYFWHGPELIALHLETLEQRTLFRAPAGYLPNMTNVTADGQAVCSVIYQDLSDRFEVDLLHGYVGFREYWEAMPHSQIVRARTDGSGADVVFEENYWIGHINTSTTHPAALTYCHEGPWEQVDNRIWGLDMATGKNWQIRPRTAGERVGHEYWHADGMHLGYHGAWPDGRKFFGRIRFDNTEPFEVDFPHETGHIHSNDFSLIVGDAGRVVRLWQWNGEGFDGPRALCEHGSSAHIQQVHVHPRFNAAGTHVLFTSDVSGYGNLYLAEVPEFASLPPVG